MRHDLYQKFIIRGWELAAEGGVLSYITSNTFYTIGSKQTTRQLLQQNELHELIRANPNTFDANVSPSIFSLQKSPPTSDHKITYVDATETSISEYRSLVGKLNNPRDSESTEETTCVNLGLKEPTRGYSIDLNIYKNTIRSAFFEPHEENMRLYENFIERIQYLSTEWEEEIQDSTNLEDNLDRIRDQHLSQITEGSVTLLGLVTLGGVGIQSGDVEEYTAYIDGSEDAEKIKQRNSNDFDYIRKNENTFRYRSRVIQDEHIRDPSTLSEKEKLTGIDGTWDGPTWVPIEKGFKQGETYYKETYEYVNWSEDAVEGIKQDGLIKNIEYSFEEGILISTGGFSDLAVRYTNNRLIGAPLVIFTTNMKNISPKYLVGVLLSEKVNRVAKTFLNSSGMQTTDIRHIPIVVPTEKQKESIEALVDEAINCRKGSAERGIEAVKSDIAEEVEELYS